ncbi:MAG: M57 family metalloprotease, partial [Ekhidna sp.]
MRRINYVLSLAVLASFTFVSCSDNSDLEVEDRSVPSEVVAQIAALGFDVDNFVPTKFENGYLVEGDIYLTDQSIAEMGQPNRLAVVEQYSTNNLVNAGGGRVITMYAPVGGNNGYSAGMIAGLDLAIARYN